MEYNYHIYIKVRLLLFRGNMENPFEIIPKVKTHILEIADNEEKALEQMDNLIMDIKF